MKGPVLQSLGVLSLQVPTDSCSHQLIDFFVSFGPLMIYLNMEKKTN